MNKFLNKGNDNFKINLLISSAGRKPLWVKSMREALQKYRYDYFVFVGDCESNCLSKYVADGFISMPEIKDENFDEISDICIRNKINIVLPSRDGELVFWAKHFLQFRSLGIEIIISRLESVDICLDKLKFYNFGKSKEFNFIKTTQSIDEIHSDRFVTKERYGSGSKSIYCDIDKSEALRLSRNLKDPIFQPYVHGEEISIDAWLNREGKLKGLILRKRELVINGESQITTIFSDNKIEELAIQILESLKLSGPVLLQGLISKDSILNVLECNTRFGGGSTISIKAGLDSFYWSIIEICGENVNDAVFIKTNKNLRQVRLPVDYYY